MRACMDERVFGDAGNIVVIQEFLSGPEVSIFAFCDGEHLSSLAAACDYKRLKDGDQGPNTGGMGSFAPPGFWDRRPGGAYPGHHYGTGGYGKCPAGEFPTGAYCMPDLC